jgi:hypothetical protein
LATSQRGVGEGEHCPWASHIFLAKFRTNNMNSFYKKNNLSHIPLFWGKTGQILKKKHLEFVFGHISTWVFFLEGGIFCISFFTSRTDCIWNCRHLMLNPLPLGILADNVAWEICQEKKKKHCPWLVSAFIGPVFINQLFEKKLILNKFRRHFDPSNVHPSSLSSHSSSWLLFVDVVFHHPNSATSLHILRNKNRRPP